MYTHSFSTSLSLILHSLIIGGIAWMMRCTFGHHPAYSFSIASLGASLFQLSLSPSSSFSGFATNATTFMSLFCDIPKARKCLPGANHDIVQEEYGQSSATADMGIMPRKAIRPE